MGIMKNRVVRFDVVALNADAQKMAVIRRELLECLKKKCSELYFMTGATVNVFQLTIPSTEELEILQKKEELCG